MREKDLDWLILIIHLNKLNKQTGAGNKRNVDVFSAPHLKTSKFLVVTYFLAPQALLLFLQVFLGFCSLFFSLLRTADSIWQTIY